MEEIREGALWGRDWGIWEVQKANTRAGEGCTGDPHGAWCVEEGAVGHTQVVLCSGQSE